MSRIICTSGAHAQALADFLTAEDHDACWMRCSVDGKPTVITTAPSSSVELAIEAVGVAL